MRVVLLIAGLVSFLAVGSSRTCPSPGDKTQISRAPRKGSAHLPQWVSSRGGLTLPFRQQQIAHAKTATVVKGPSSKGKAVGNRGKSPAAIDAGEAYATAVRRTLLAVGAAFAFGFGLWFMEGRQPAMEFFAGYLIEESLSVDNIFVFIMLFEYFKVPIEYQSRALSWGIMGAVVMRGIMIFVGVAAIQRFRWVVLLFAGVLLASAFKLLAEVGHEGGEEDLSNNVLVAWAKKLVHAVDEYDGDNFFTRRNGKRYATPLFMCLICIELSDFVFAVDSIPAVLGVSKDPLIVYSSNIFAIMALRSLYTLVATAVNSLEYIKPSVALVLAFVGGKMIAEFFHVEVPISVSLAVVMSLLGGGIGLSLLKQRVLARSDVSG
ncbi:hypothetical protein NSK_003686 [Nannochloropsis salina CCMP1776]|uniref:Tellurium resistance protein TerC n=1 Tax=Nannochloropsis salina CCMP1776 TaxID=1027361 RepID=A0A4D9D5K5_9STRA|nr:hypothetical protein NSK_003686 [Nannochloropsis salina CCMP1776]|eukprot:TFJ85263.1 hypothetical protein NSK_003686 [Nannochloropsis salina CCMP1776]